MFKAVYLGVFKTVYLGGFKAVYLGVFKTVYLGGFAAAVCWLEGGHQPGGGADGERSGGEGDPPDLDQSSGTLSIKLEVSIQTLINHQGHLQTH